MVQNKEVINQADKTSWLENLKPEERASIQMNRTLKYLYSEESKQSFYEESDDKVTYKMDVVKDYLTHLCKKADWTLKSRKEMMDDMQRENRESWQDFRVSTPWIMAVQIVLEYLQYDIGAIDWNKWNTTIAAIKSFQRENWLTVDWDAGPATIAALLAKLPDSSDILENGIQENWDEEDDNQETIEPTDEINDDSEELEEKPEEESEEEPKEEQKEETDEDIIEPTNPEVIDNWDTVVEVGLTDIDIKEIDWVMKMINEDLNWKKFYVIEWDIVKINVTVIKEYLMKYKDMERKDFQQEIWSRNYTIILAVQLMLYLRWYTKIKIDWLRWPQTISIIVELQKKYWIIADGVVWPVTISIIIEIILWIKPMPLPNPVIPVVPVIPVEPETPVETETQTEEVTETETQTEEVTETETQTEEVTETETQTEEVTETETQTEEVTETETQTEEVTETETQTDEVTETETQTDEVTETETQTEEVTETETQTEEPTEEESDESLNDNLGYWRVECDYLAKSEYPSENMIITNRQYLLKLWLEELYEKYDDNYFKDHSLAIHYSDLTSTADWWHDITYARRSWRDVFVGYKDNEPKWEIWWQVMRGECLYVEINKWDVVNRFEDNMVRPSSMAESIESSDKESVVRSLLASSIVNNIDMDLNRVEQDALENNLSHSNAFNEMIYWPSWEITLNLWKDVLQRWLTYFINEKRWVKRSSKVSETINSKTNGGNLDVTINEAKNYEWIEDIKSSIKTCLTSFYTKYNRVYPRERVDITSLNINSQVDALFA